MADTDKIINTYIINSSHSSNLNKNLIINFVHKESF